MQGYSGCNRPYFGAKFFLASSEVNLIRLGNNSIILRPSSIIGVLPINSRSAWVWHICDQSVNRYEPAVPVNLQCLHLTLQGNVCSSRLLSGLYHSRFWWPKWKLISSLWNIAAHWNGAPALSQSYLNEQSPGLSILLSCIPCCTWHSVQWHNLQSNGASRFSWYCTLPQWQLASCLTSLRSNPSPCWYSRYGAWFFQSSSFAVGALWRFLVSSILAPKICARRVGLIDFETRQEFRAWVVCLSEVDIKCCGLEVRLEWSFVEEEKIVNSRRSNCLAWIVDIYSFNWCEHILQASKLV